MVVSGVLFWANALHAQNGLPGSIPPAVTGQFKAIALCGAGHPRCAGIKNPAKQNIVLSPSPGPYKYHQYPPGMALTDFVSIADVLEPGPPIEGHMTLMSETITKRPKSNSIAFWGDAKSMVNGGKVWGGFFSARSEFAQKGDSQLIGVEIDVLNDGMPGNSPNNAKVGLQIVGFGKQNTNAVQIMTDGPTTGKFRNGFIVEKGAIAPQGAIFAAAPQNTQTGLYLYGSQFSDAAVLLSENSRIVFRSDGKLDASIYRDHFFNGHLVLQAGPSGIRFVNAQGNRNLFRIYPDGKIDHASLVWQQYWPWIGGGGCLLLVLTVAVFVLAAACSVLRRRLAELERLCGVEPRQSSVPEWLPGLRKEPA